MKSTTASGIPVHCAHVALRDVTTLTPNPRNPNKHGDAQVALLAKIIRHQGWRAPITISKRSGFIVTGHGRLQAALLLQVEKVPVDEQDFATEADEWAHLIADNRIAELADVDRAMLRDLAEELDTGAFDMDLTGFDYAALEELMTAEHPGGEADAEPQIDKAAELNKDWQVKPGDLWLVGEHRLLCGDSTKAEDVAKVMGGAKANAVLTDPPYGQNQAGVTNDAPEDHTELMRSCVAVLPITDGVIVAFQSPRTFHAWTDAARAKGFTFERMLWLYKAAQCTFPWRGWILTSESIPVCSIGKADWTDVHPFAHDCYYLSEVSGELAPDSGWHGSVKPLKVVSDLLSRICKESSSVFDPFLGSGTTMVACGNLGRKCRGIEISPDYCAVILQRMKDAFPNITIERA